MKRPDPSRVAMAHRRPRSARQKRGEFARLIAQGVPTADACRIVGITPRTGELWRYGRTITNSNGRYRSLAGLRGLRTLGALAALVALLSLLVGLLDAMRADQLGQRLIGGLLALCGLALLYAAYASVFRTEHLEIAQALFLAGAVPGLLLFFLQVSQVSQLPSSLRYDWWRVLLWLLAASVPLTAVVILWTSRHKQLVAARPRLRMARTRLVRILSSAGLIGLALTAAQLILTTYYTPVKRSESLSIAHRISPSRDQRLLGAGSSMQGLHGTVSLDNAGDAKLVVLGSLYLVTGYIGSARPTAEQTDLHQWRELILEGGDVERYYRYGSRSERQTLLAVGRSIPGWGRYVFPGTKVQLDFLAYSPKNIFDRYLSTVLVITARADKIRVKPAKYQSPYTAVSSTSSPTVLFEGIVSEPSLVSELVRGTRHVYIVYTRLPSSPWPRIGVCTESKGINPRDCVGLTGWSEYYGVNFYVAWSSAQNPS